MSAPRLDDTQLATALRAIAPAEAPPGLRAGILDLASTTPQRRSLPSPLAAFGEVDPTLRRRTLLLAAALLLILAASGLAAAGAMLFERQADPLVDLSVVPSVDPLVVPSVDPLVNLSLEPPADLPSFVRSAYGAMPELGPMTIELVRDDGTKARIYVDASGAIRQEEYASAAATSPETYQVLKGTAVAETIMVDGRPRFYEQAERIGEDPRVFVYAALGAASGGPPAPGCEVAVSPGEVYAYVPAHAWTHVGVELVAGRPAHHVKCATRELWIDDATRLTLRSRGAAVDESGFPIDGGFRTVEVASIVTGPQPAALFDMARPPGVEAISGDEHECATNPYCNASSGPVVTPPPASGAPPADVASVIERAVDVTTVPAFEVLVSVSNGNYPDSTIRSLSDGAGRFRVEDTGQVGTAFEATTVTLTGPDGAVGSQHEIDGTETWHRLSARGATTGYPLALPEACAGGWEFVGTDLVRGSPADHVRCTDGGDDPDWWIDRELGLVVRVQGPPDDRYGTRVREVTELRFADQPAEMFELPAGTDVQP